MTLEQFLSGVTDRDEVIVDRQGLNSIPAGDIDWIIDIGSGDGVWSALAYDYAKPINMIALDHRYPGVNTIRPYWLEGILSPHKEVYVPSGEGRLFQERTGPAVMLAMKTVKGFTLPELLNILGADPGATVIRVRTTHPEDVVSQLKDMPTFLGVLLLTPNNIPGVTAAQKAMLTALSLLFTSVEIKPCGDICHLVLTNLKKESIHDDHIDREAETTVGREAGPTETADSEPPDDGAGSERAH